MNQTVKTTYQAETPVTAITADIQLSADLLQADALHTLGENAAAMMHELRSPLQAIRAHIQLLERKTAGLGEDISRHFEPLYHSVEHLNNLLDQYLRLSRFMEASLEPLDVAASIRELLPLLRSMAVMRQVELREDLPPALPVCLADEQQLKRLMFNLFANALDACDGVADAYVCIRLTREGPELSLAVQDNGSGIAADKLELIWQPFYTSKVTGTGLGLPGCLKIAADHGGSLTVVSKPGEGSCFTLKLPIQK